MQKYNSKFKNDEKDTIIIHKLNNANSHSVRDNQNKTFIIFLIGQKDQDGEVKIVINGSNAHVQILGIIIGSGNQKIKLYTLQDHRKPESISDLLIKSVLFDNARFNYEGLIDIKKGAQKSNAYQKNQNLLMSKNAWADSRPYLEILANDVRCTHGATVGKINEDQLYYLQTRGLSIKDATHLLVTGFLADVLSRIPGDIIREKLEGKIEKRLKGLLERSM